MLFFMALFHFTYQYHTRFLISAHPHQHLLFPVLFFFTVVILIEVMSHYSFDLYFPDDQ